MMNELREQLYAMMDEATNELARRNPEACGALLGTPIWKEYRTAENAAGDANDIKNLGNYLRRMRHLLDQMASM